jgi:DNA polymerase-3 subunit epsilon
MRQVILDTETTGLEPSEGHRIIELGCVELVNRRPTGNNYHQYVNPEREIDAGAIEVHGITNEALADKPHFADVAEEFVAYIAGAELIIHNAPFDVGFLNHEFLRMAAGTTAATRRVEELCAVIDTLALARRMHPGQKNDLDSLCKRYGVDNTQRTLHGALLDAEILADVYLAMTGGQTGLFEDARTPLQEALQTEIRRIAADRKPLPVIAPSAEELTAHRSWLEEIDKRSKGQCLWKRLEA